MSPELFPNAVSPSGDSPEQLQFSQTRSGRAWLLVQRLLDSKVCTLHSRKRQLSRRSVSSQVKAMGSSCSERLGETSLGMTEAFLCPRNKFTLGTHLALCYTLGILLFSCSVMSYSWGSSRGQKTTLVLVDFLPFSLEETGGGSWIVIYGRERKYCRKGDKNCVCWGGGI